jgi:hypothetical protein
MMAHQVAANVEELGGLKIVAGLGGITGFER